MFIKSSSDICFSTLEEMPLVTAPARVPPQLNANNASALPIFDAIVIPQPLKTWIRPSLARDCETAKSLGWLQSPSVVRFQKSATRRSTDKLGASARRDLETPCKTPAGKSSEEAGEPLVRSSRRDAASKRPGNRRFAFVEPPTGAARLRCGGHGGPSLLLHAIANFGAHGKIPRWLFADEVDRGAVCLSVDSRD
jgi:hypothetical protein